MRGLFSSPSHLPSSASTPRLPRPRESGVSVPSESWRPPHSSTGLFVAPNLSTGLVGYPGARDPYGVKGESPRSTSWVGLRILATTSFRSTSIRLRTPSMLLRIHTAPAPRPDSIHRLRRRARGDYRDHGFGVDVYSVYRELPCNLPPKASLRRPPFPRTVPVPNRRDGVGSIALPVSLLGRRWWPRQPRPSTARKST